MITKANLDTALARLEDKIERKMILRMEQLRGQLGGEIKSLEAKNKMTEALVSREEGLPDSWQESCKELAEEVKDIKIKIAALEEIVHEKMIFPEDKDQ